MFLKSDYPLLVANSIRLAEAAEEKARRFANVYGGCLCRMDDDGCEHDVKIWERTAQEFREDAEFYRKEIQNG